MVELVGLYRKRVLGCLFKKLNILPIQNLEHETIHELIQPCVMCHYATQFGLFIYG